MYLGTNVHLSPDLIIYLNTLRSVVFIQTNQQAYIKTDFQSLGLKATIIYIFSLFYNKGAEYSNVKF